MNMQPIINDMELAIHKITYVYGFVEVRGSTYMDTYHKLYKHLSFLIKRPLHDQLQRRIYVENQARREAKDMANLRHSL